MVGGFGDSFYLNHRLREWCRKNGDICLHNPTKCQVAITRGAALRGLESGPVGSKQCKLFYGFSANRKFREGIDDEADAHWSPITGEKLCGHRMHWLITKVCTTTTPSWPFCDHVLLINKYRARRSLPQPKGS